MKPLSLSQAQACENAQTARCRCRCAGAMHGAARVPADADRSAFIALDDDDPHRLPGQLALFGGAR